MKRYLLRNKEGLYLNTDYHSSWNHGHWRPREGARLYKSLGGIKSALSGTAFPAMKAYIGMADYKTPGDRRWTDEDRDENARLWRGIYAIPRDKWWELLAQDGYVLEELEI